ncbi:MAG: alpha/beta hydrolase, partial [Verrucomicrobiota bacterium]
MRIILVLLLLVGWVSFGAADEVVQLWEPEKTPHRLGKGVDEVYPSLTCYPVPEAEKSNGAAVLVCPGGGYGGLAMDHEGVQIAQWFNQRGVAAYVLSYRLGSKGYHFPTQLADVQRAMRWVRFHAHDNQIDPKRISIIGFSAGGHLTSMASTKFSEKAYEPTDEID